MTDTSDPSALIVVDVQQGFDDPSWGPRNNPGCESNIAALISAWRERGWPIVLVRHDSRSPRSPLFAGSPGNAFKSGIAGAGEDLLVVKHTNSAFYGTPSLDAWLREHGLHAVTICGITTNHCCETTARMAGNLGYRTTFVIDATCTFDRPDLDGTIIPADEIARITAANLHGEFATVQTTSQVLHAHRHSPAASAATV
ncbi:MAG: cysteine hydrolase [Myxococcales bacterium]|nr:cysteine hydrolase [Myxococcales bacterium]